jgi:SAM-dependent methyltransferase
MSTGFYRAFEDRHRGSRETILARLRVYLPFVHAIARAHPQPFIDVGCGRGEWLEMLQAEGVRARGVDLDAGMLEACRARGLEAELGDAVGYLQGLPDASVAGVSGFHIAEHLPFAVLDELIAQAHRVLVPGGILILETPNPENLFVATSSFYLDPTHVRPLPPLLLGFLAEYKGFARAKVLRLQESAELAARASIDLLDVLGGASPDYAIVALKASGQPGAVLDEQFARDIGMSSADLAMRFDHQLREDRRMLAESRELAHQYDRLLLEIRRRMNEVEAVSKEAHEASLIARRAQVELQAVYASSSWRWSRPIRVAGGLVRSLLSPAVRLRLSALTRKLGIDAPLRAVWRRLRGRPVHVPPPPPPPAPMAEPSETERLLERRLGAGAEKQD